jgi:DNA-binding transcriptional LysR family regulator
MEARQICDQVSRARRAVNQAAAGELGRLRVAGVPLAFLDALPLVVPKFRKDNPNIVLDLREASTHESIDALLTGAVDVALVRVGDPINGLEILPLRTGRFEVAVPPDHRLATATSIELAELAYEPFVMTARNISPYYYDQTLSALAAAGITPRTVIEASSIQAQLGYVACGMGVSLVPGSGIPVHNHRAVLVPLEETISSTELAVAWVAGPTSLVLDHFVKMVREEVAEDHAAVLA